MSRLMSLFVEVPAPRDPLPVFSRFAALLANRLARASKPLKGGARGRA